MRRNQYREISSDEFDDYEKRREKKKQKERQVLVEEFIEVEGEEDVDILDERTATGGNVDLEEEIKFGEQLHDDLINSFCDKLQAVCPRKLEALLAIQFLMVTDAENIRKFVTGKHSAMQVIYDQKRSHYILVHYNARKERVEIYDSLQQFKKNGYPFLLDEIETHICHLFGHLFTTHITCIIDGDYEEQTDNFSCGYRVIGALVDLACGRRPSSQRYSRSRILELMRMILTEEKPTWEMFESAEYGVPKSRNGESRYRLAIVNTSYATPVSSVSSSSSMASLNSNISQKTVDSDETRKFVLKTPYRLAEFEVIEDDEFPKTSSSYHSLPSEKQSEIPTIAMKSLSFTPGDHSIIGYIRSSCQHLMDFLRWRTVDFELKEVKKREKQD
ncbi:hypothetical protein CRE_08067 [Caenorhabditis remanei]|uniref:Ubiquitin-like protease family profile domain-containing protein n=1 Tax=Caenorhabditis remanei TaxID=31234 RepID=E3M371_CAERE|nr:hypothetical protein CRE_08067 [Caenorhabditis remanei]